MTIENRYDHINYIVYDLDSNVVTQGEQLTTTTANTQWEVLNLSTVITQDGYLKAYLINEDDEDVWFDDFTITHTTSPIVQEHPAACWLLAKTIHWIVSSRSALPSASHLTPTTSNV